MDVDLVYQHSREWQAMLKFFAQSLVRKAHLLAFRRSLPTRVAIFMHELPESSWPILRELVPYFKEHGYSFVDPDGFRAPRDERRVFLSFDDNFREWHRALPLFEKLGVHATFYVNSQPMRDLASAVEIDAYFDRIEHTGERATMTVAELREVAAAGHTIGHHTHSHFVLSALTVEEAQAEIRRGKETLEDWLATEVRHFSYPYGMRRHFSDALKQYCWALGCPTISTGIGSRLHEEPDVRLIHRTVWRLDRSLEHNVQNLEIDGRVWSQLTGRNAAT